MGSQKLNDSEEKLLLALLEFYEEVGPAATPNLKGLHIEAGIEKHQLDESVRSLSKKGFIEYWELSPAVRLTEAGLVYLKGAENDRGKDDPQD